MRAVKRHSLRQHRYQPYASQPQSPISATYVVKVNHIPARSITKQELGRDRNGREFNYVSLNLCHGKDSDDFGYINFLHKDDAKYAVAEWDGRNVNGKRVSAFIQEAAKFNAIPDFTAPPTNPTSGSTQEMKKTVRTVKVLIGSNGTQLHAKDLESYFRKFGKIEKKPFICRGTPDYAYINYENPQSAMEACREAKIQIKDTSISVKPAQGNSQAIKSFECEKIACDPLVAKYLASNSAIKEFARRNEATIDLNDSGLVVWVEKQSLAHMLNFIMEEMKSLKKQMAETVLTPHCYHLPTLCDKQSIETLTKMQEANLFSIKILDQSETSAASLPDLQKQLCQPFTAQGLHSHVPTIDDRKIKSFLVHDDSDTEYQWQWEDVNGVFIPYHPKLCSSFNQQFQLAPDSTEFCHEIGGHTYTIDFSAFTQTNLQTRRQRKIRKVTSGIILGTKCHIKVKVRAHKSGLSLRVRELLKELRSDIKVRTLPLPENSDENLKQQLCKITDKRLVKCQFVTVNKQVTMQVEGASSYVEAVVKELGEHINKTIMQRTRQQLGTTVFPSTWEPQENNIELKEVESEEEKRSIEILIYKTMRNARIISVKRIQNVWLWEKYCFFKQRMSEKNKGAVNEKELFHGTRSTPPEKVYKSEQGFDFRFSSHGMWGTGTYFAVNASYSDSYAFQSGQNKQVILAKVLTGETVCCPSNSTLKKPPTKRNEKHTATLWGAFGMTVQQTNTTQSSESEEQFEDELYDSVSGHTNGSDIFVVYDHEKAYPAYLIEYK